MAADSAEMSQHAVERGIGTAVTCEGFRAMSGVDPMRASLGAGWRLSATELAALARIRAPMRNRQEASPRDDSCLPAQTPLPALEQDFADMERRPGAGGAGAFAWLLTMLTARVLFGIIAWAIYSAHGVRW